MLETLLVLLALGAAYAIWRGLRGSEVDDPDRRPDLARISAEWEADREEQRALAFAENYDDLQRRINALPPHFRKRIERFRLNNPRFLIEYGAYELRACEEAVAMVEWARQEASMDGRTPSEWLRDLSGASDEDQQEMYDFVHDDHIERTWSMALWLARQALKDPRWVEVEHGTLEAKVGCKDYGCLPTKDEVWRESEPEILRETSGGGGQDRT